MPLYLYRCPECGKEFEERRKVEERKEVYCPTCTERSRGKCRVRCKIVPGQFSFVMRERVKAVGSDREMRVKGISV